MVQQAAAQILTPIFERVSYIVLASAHCGAHDAIAEEIFIIKVIE